MPENAQNLPFQGPAGKSSRQAESLRGTCLLLILGYCIRTKKILKKKKNCFLSLDKSPKSLKNAQFSSDFAHFPPISA
jgi:hypothetical protein